MSVDAKCCICQADFAQAAMVGTKCKACNGLYPDATCLEDIANPNKERARLLNEPVIREIIYEILGEAGLKRKRCEKCRALFFAKSPAAKFCSECRSNVSIGKKDTDEK